MLHAWALPYLQLALVPYKTFSFLSHSLKSLSIARRYVLDGLADPQQVGQVPLCNSAAFKNSQHLTYYSTKLISMGVLPVADMYDDALKPMAQLLRHVGPTWRELHTHAPTNLHKVPVADWSLPSVWAGVWGKSLTPKRLASNPFTGTRCSPKVWKFLWCSNLPPSLMDFCYQAL